jgi:hypothetical protein
MCGSVLFRSQIHIFGWLNTYSIVLSRLLQRCFHCLYGPGAVIISSLKPGQHFIHKVSLCFFRCLRCCDMFLAAIPTCSGHQLAHTTRHCQTSECGGPDATVAVVRCSPASADQPYCYDEVLSAMPATVPPLLGTPPRQPTHVLDADKHGLGFVSFS